MATITPAAVYVQNLLERAPWLELSSGICRKLHRSSWLSSPQLQVVSGRSAAEECAHRYVPGLVRKAGPSQFLVLPREGFTVFRLAFWSWEAFAAAAIDGAHLKLCEGIKLCEGNVRNQANSHTAADPPLQVLHGMLRHYVPVKR